MILPCFNLAKDFTCYILYSINLKCLADDKIRQASSYCLFIFRGFTFCLLIFSSYLISAPLKLHSLSQLHHHAMVKNVVSLLPTCLLSAWDIAIYPHISLIFFFERIRSTLRTIRKEKLKAIHK